jgi:hypothetical protein
LDDPSICVRGDAWAWQGVEERDHDVQWSDAGQVALTPPPGSGWSALVDLELRWPDGTRLAWAEEASVEAATIDHVLAAPEAARQLGGIARLVAYVRYRAPGSEDTLSLGTGSQFVEVGAAGLLPTTERFSTMMGVGLIDDPTDLQDLDDEVVR